MGRRARTAKPSPPARLAAPVAIAVGVVVGYAVIALGGVVQDGVSAVAANLARTLAAVAVAGLAIVAGRAQAGRRSRLSWAMLGLGLLCWGFGDAARTWSELHWGALPRAPSLADIGYLAMLLLAFTGVVLRPLPRRRLVGRWLLLVDAALATVVVAAVAWIVVFGPAFARLDAAPPVQALIVAYPVGQLAVLCGALIGVLREDDRRPGTRLLLAGLAAAAAAFWAYALLAVQGGDALQGADPAGQSVSVVWFAALALIGLAAVAEHAEPAEAQSAPSGGGRARRFVVPTVALASATLLVWIVSLQRGGAQAGPAQLAIGIGWLLLLARVFLEYRAATAALGRERRLRIGHAGTFRREQRRRRQLEAVRELSAELTRELDLTALLSLMTRRAADLVEAPLSAAFLWDASSGMLVPRAWHGLGSWFATVRLRPGEGVAGRAVEVGRGVILNEYAAAREAFRPLLFHTTVTAALAAPIVSRGRLLGAVVVADNRPGRTFCDHDLSLIELLADQAAIAIEHANLVDEAASSEALRELAHLKTELLSTVSHELRTPLTLIHGYAELLRGRADTLTPADVTQMADEILSGSRTMIRLVDDLLDFSRLDRPRVTLDVERVDVADLLDRHVKSWRGQAGGERLCLDVAGPLEGLADSARLHQIVRHLVSNALSYAPCGPVHVRGVPEPGWIRLEVADHGPGIPAEELPRVWETFFRGESARNSPNRGSGLGLAVVKQLVELHGGYVDVESRSGHGATFRVWLPAAPGATVPADHDAPAGSAVIH